MLNDPIVEDHGVDVAKVNAMARDVADLITFAQESGGYRISDIDFSNVGISDVAKGVDTLLTQNILNSLICASRSEIFVREIEPEEACCTGNLWLIRSGNRGLCISFSIPKDYLFRGVELSDSREKESFELTLEYFEPDDYGQRVVYMDSQDNNFLRGLDYRVIHSIIESILKIIKVNL